MVIVETLRYIYSKFIKEPSSIVILLDLLAVVNLNIFLGIKDKLKNKLLMTFIVFYIHLFYFVISIVR